jgi:hypothetical protein
MGGYTGDTLRLLMGNAESSDSSTGADCYVSLTHVRFQRPSYRASIVRYGKHSTFSFNFCLNPKAAEKSSHISGTEPGKKRMQVFSAFTVALHQDMAVVDLIGNITPAAAGYDQFFSQNVILFQ